MENQNKNLETVEDIISILKDHNFKFHICHEIEDYRDVWYFDENDSYNRLVVSVCPSSKLISARLFYYGNLFDQIFDFTNATIFRGLEETYGWCRKITRIKKQRDFNDDVHNKILQKLQLY